MRSASNTVNNKRITIHIHNTFGPKRTERQLQKPGKDKMYFEFLYKLHLGSGCVPFSFENIWSISRRMAVGRRNLRPAVETCFSTSSTLPRNGPMLLKALK